ncbi:DnaJ domain-containing protein [Agrobacterium tumefaciens]|uniref:DnaJ domain-containing protein n=1 Tax=Agrobacterium tumefaciens TaxID=358 RepID=UPI0009BBF9A3|nr:DnaJ domain-containing protein [Agrobacterium tumefaciens]
MPDLQRARKYTSAPTNADVARYQKEATTGSRRTFGTRAEDPKEIPIPSTERPGSAKTLNARKGGTTGRTNAGQQERKLKPLEAKAFETLGLSPRATADEIKSRYKERLKMHHPDANNGDRNSEDELRAAIGA